MKTDDLIALLAQDAPLTARLGDRLRLGVLAALLLAGLLFGAAIGVRPDLGAAMASDRFLFKFVVTIALTVSAGILVFRIGRPGVPLRVPAWWLLSPLVLAVAAALAELLAVPSDAWGARMIGENASHCLTMIPLLSIVPLACLLHALRYGAPERPGLAGAVAGLFASGIAATLYASSCTDDSPLFILLWYPMAIALVTVAGWLAGRRLLQW
ncbi:NrsF family protein [Methylobrevis pamukkalensis]|uniref:Anti-sigma-F factor NrsF n=1 Tax=Methylobrevis pamukkalensis TaxID=1439726 RepID=A0A1E3H8Y7_9HYPH|nr:DUF1109 domain-containing protein [Methylobrevis pamukkalensis]ODN72595.1 hypothetical protein A6302_00087 [Methylobrevis pamukkalensis]